MISREEVRKRIYNPNSDAKYDGFDMSGCRDTGGIEVCRSNNFNFIKEKFRDIFWDMDLENFNLWCWKGSVWLGEKDVFGIESHSEMIKDFTSQTTQDIISWLAQYKPYPKQEVTRIISKEDRYSVLKRQHWRCNQCGCTLKYSKDSSWDGEVAHIDHIHPFSKKGTYSNGA